MGERRLGGGCLFSSRRNQRTDDVEREIVVPREAVEPEAAVAALPAFAFLAGAALQRKVVETVPLAHELFDVQTGVRLELEHALLREDVRDDLALAGVLGARARVEEPALDGDEGVVEVGLERARAVPVDGLERLGVGDGEVVRGEADEFAYRDGLSIADGSESVGSCGVTWGK